ncbi:MAG: T9SS type A sorting domain-containing protein, partial [Bacteroidota bacterium]
KMIYVMPGLGAPAAQNEYTYLVNDLIPYIDAHYRTIPDRWHRAMDGFSLGGLITTNLIASVPRLFSSVGSYDGTLSMFDNSLFLNASSTLIYSLKQMQLLYHTGSVGATNNSNNVTTFSVLNSKGIYNTLPSFQLHPSAQHNWYFADLHMAVTLPLHFAKMHSPQNSLGVALTDSFSGKTFSGPMTIHWSRKNFSDSAATYIFYSNNNGSQWNQLYMTRGSDSSFLWNTLSYKDGTRYRIKVIAAIDTLYGQSITEQFTLNNPGNAAPDIDFTSLNERDTLSGDFLLQWKADDADGDALTLSADISYNSGVTWNTLFTSQTNSGTYPLDTRSLANSDNVLIRLSCTDGLTITQTVSLRCILYNKRITALGAQFIHQSGYSDAKLEAIRTSKEQNTSADYVITFNESFGKKTYSVKDGNGSLLVNNAVELDGKTEGPLFNGFRLLISDIPKAEVNLDSSRWIVGSSQLTGDVKLIDIDLGSELVKALPFPADYEIRLTNVISDTSLSLYGAPAFPVPFYVWNRTLNQRTKFIYVELDGNLHLTRNDELYLFEKDSSNSFFMTWHITFTGNENASDPVSGDVFMVRVKKPLTMNDRYQFLYTPSSVKSNDASIPERYSLSQNYPNPFNPSTSIEFSIPKSDIVEIQIYDMLGRTIETLIHEVLPAGAYSVRWNAAKYSSGIYFYRLTTKNFTQTNKMILLQ